MWCRVQDSRNDVESKSLEERKIDHLDLAIKSQVATGTADLRFDFEPLLAAHPTPLNDDLSCDFLGKKIKAPLWISSMTGGAKEAGKLNKVWARIASEFGLGMGLGSCRTLLSSSKHISDFDLRPILGDELPFYANLGIAQVEELIDIGEQRKLRELVETLDADGLIVHINPLQEWFQPEGDRYKRAPLETLKRLLDVFEGKLIVKEVGQGFGPRSLEELIKLPLSAIDFAAYGGTNFTKLELMRGKVNDFASYSQFSHVGHTADEMIICANKILEKLGSKAKCRNFIISGGVRDSLHGFYLMENLVGASVYAQAKAFLVKGREGYSALKEYVESELKNLALSKAFLKART